MILNRGDAEAGTGSCSRVGKQGQARVAESRPSSPSGPQRSRNAALEAKRTSINNEIGYGEAVFVRACWARAGFAYRARRQVRRRFSAALLSSVCTTSNAHWSPRHSLPSTGTCRSPLPSPPTNDQAKQVYRDVGENLRFYGMAHYEDVVALPQGYELGWTRDLVWAQLHAADESYAKLVEERKRTLEEAARKS